jgi:putative spermidine/putrescine transport system ATP-binding protein
LQITAGLTRQDAGRIVVDNADITDLPASRRNIGVVFQNYALFPHLTVFENVAFGLRLRRANTDVMRKKVRAVLGLVRLVGVEDRLPRQLSGGQQQRVALARALVIEPRLLLLDEPLSNLDRALREEMRTELKRIRADADVTTVFVTHDRTEAMDLGDQVAVMREGSFEQIGSPQEIYETPKTRFVAHLLGETNFLDGVLCDESAPLIQIGSIRLSADHMRLPAGVRRGDPVVVGIRPESIRLVTGGTSGMFALAFRIETSSYLGNVIEFRGRLQPDGMPLSIKGVSPAEWRDASVHGADGMIHIGWDASDVLVFVP